MRNQISANSPSFRIDQLLKELPRRADVHVVTPFGFDQPVPAGVDPGEIPKTTAELGELVSYTYDLTVRRAGELSIPIAGSVSGGFDRRVVVLEWTRYKTLRDNSGVEHRYGYVLRFCLTVSKWDSQTKVSLPFLAAQAELGNIEASWMMQVRGLVGPEIDGVVLPPRQLNVDTFVIAIQSLKQAVDAIDNSTTQFVPGILLETKNPAAPEVQYWLAAVKTFAVDSIRRGRTRAAAQARLGTSDPAAVDIVTEVYYAFEIADPNEQPGNGAREQARVLLRGIEADT